jgi:hypothetical protein
MRFAHQDQPFNRVPAANRGWNDAQNQMLLPVE